MYKSKMLVLGQVCKKHRKVVMETQKLTVLVLVTVDQWLEMK
jgi:hypothetical protein